MTKKIERASPAKHIRKKDPFSAISIKSEVAVMFRDYSKRFDRPHSQVLYQVILFLKKNQLNPFDDGMERIDKQLKAIEKRLTEQTDYLISIIKNMERTKINPIYEMTLALYTAHIDSEEKKEPRPERKIRDNRSFSFPKPDTVLKSKYDMLNERHDSYRKICKRILDSTKKVEPLIGRPYIQIEMDIKEFNILRNELK